MFTALIFRPTTVKPSPTSSCFIRPTSACRFNCGYLHFNSRNHATGKYGFGPNVIFHWDNIGFDGPAIAAPRAYEIPDNTVLASHNGRQVQNLGHQLYDATSGKAAGIYNLSSKVILYVQNVNTVGHHFSHDHDETPSSMPVCIRRLQIGQSAIDSMAGTWKNRNLTTGDLAV